MSNESIFNKLVRGENAHTQLLCNLLKRENVFREALLENLSPHLANFVQAAHLKTQVHLAGCGQADILIRSPQLTIIIEVKTEVHRSLTEKQQLLDHPASYLRWLEREKAKGSEAWLVFLVPASWKHREQKEDEITAYQKRFGSKGIQVRQVFWEDISRLIKKPVDKNEISLLEEFRLLLEQRFGPIGFTEEEANTMFQDIFPMSTMLELIALVNKLGEDNVSKSIKLDITKNEIGWYFKKGGKSKACWLYLGCWLDFWEDTHRPICFGVSDVSPAVQKAFVASLKKVYGQEPVPCGDYLLGWIPEEDLKGSDAPRVISPKINRIWESMCAAAD